MCYCPTTEDMPIFQPIISNTGRCEGDYYCAFKKRQLLCVCNSKFYKRSNNLSRVKCSVLETVSDTHESEDEEGEQKITIETLELAHKVTFYPLFTLALLLIPLFSFQKVPIILSLLNRSIYFWHRLQLKRNVFSSAF